MADLKLISQSRHPFYIAGMTEWDSWRVAYEAGEEFVEDFLEKFSSREDNEDFKIRKRVTPIPGFAASAINDIRNAIFQRMVDISRSGGSSDYQNAIFGLEGGIDRRGSTMNAFLGQKVLTELLVMGAVGVFVDNSDTTGMTLAGERSTPYVYHYRREDILSWAHMSPDKPSEFQSVLLRDTVTEYDQLCRLPTHTTQRYRLLYIDEKTGRVNVRFLNEKDEDVEEPKKLELTRIPFVLLDIGNSLMQSIVRHQIALLNLASSDVYYALKANFPFYVEQRDMRAAGTHLKQAATDGTATTGGQGAKDANIEVGTMHGRAYGLQLNQPAFIHPSSEPLKASIALQEKLESDIRRLVNLAVANLGSRQSAEAKNLDNQGLEAGLSFIGQVLESGERSIAQHWAAYENRQPSQRQIATIKYPDRYELKSDAERIDEAKKRGEAGLSLPSRTAKREIAKQNARALLSGKVPVAVIQKIEQEIDKAPFITGDPEVILKVKEQGLAGEQVCSIALGFDEDEYLTAREDHTERIKRIAEAQGQGDNPASRGVPDLSGDPSQDASEEKESSRDTTMRDTTERRVRGEGG